MSAGHARVSGVSGRAVAGGAVVDGATLGQAAAGVCAHGHAPLVAAGVREQAVLVGGALGPPAAGVRVAQRARQALAPRLVADGAAARVHAAALERARVLALPVDAGLGGRAV